MNSARNNPANRAAWARLCSAWRLGWLLAGPGRLLRHEPRDELERDVRVRRDAARAMGTKCERRSGSATSWRTGPTGSFVSLPTPVLLLVTRQQWYRDWLAGDRDRWLIYVVRDFDTVAEYWQSVRDGLSESSEPERKTEADENDNRGGPTGSVAFPRRPRTPPIPTNGSRSTAAGTRRERAPSSPVPGPMGSMPRRPA